MARFSRFIVIAALIAVGGIGSYAAGVAVGNAQSKKAFAATLTSVQADLGLTHLLRLRELENDLSRGCASEAYAKVRFDIHTQMFVLSTLYREHKGTWVVEAIEKRAPSLPAELEQFKKAYESWTEPKCVK